MEAKNFIIKGLEWGQAQWINSSEKFKTILSAINTRSDIAHGLQQLSRGQLHEVDSVVEQYYQRRNKDPLGYYLAKTEIERVASSTR